MCNGPTVGEKLSWRAKAALISEQPQQVAGLWSDDHEEGETTPLYDGALEEGEKKE